MISGLKGSGVKDITQYLMEQAVKRPWDEDPLAMSEEVMKSISLEVVRERLLDHVHQEIPYGIQHHLVDWKELRDGSLGIEQHFITHKMSQRKILVGKNGSKIGYVHLGLEYTCMFCYWFGLVQFNETQPKGHSLLSITENKGEPT
ncbi:hypothetical protein CsSME_00046163 [Camellia sinensis var. sinensis]